MSQRNRSQDRFAQMSKQEEIIAKKRQEILEKQRTIKLAVQVAEAQNLAAKLKTTEVPPPPPIASVETELDEEDGQQQAVQEVVDASTNNDGAPEAEPSEPQAGNGKEIASTASVATKSLNSFTGKTGKISFGLKRQQLLQPSVEQPPPKVMNTFCNDGSFLENFKKILEKHEKPPQPPIIVPPVPQTSTEEPVDNNNASSPQQQQQVEMSMANSTNASSVIPAMPNISVTSSAPNPLAFSLPVQAVGVQAPPPPPPFAFNPTLLPQGPPQMSLPAAFFHPGHLPMQLHPVAAATAPPPPPPPPQLPLALANIAPIYMHMGPSAVEAMQLNAIPPPKEFDLNAIPKPQINLEAIQMPTQTESGLNLIPDHVVAAVVNPQQPPPPPPPMQEEEEQDKPQEQQKQQHQQQQQQQQIDMTPSPPQETCIQLPTCIENLIALVAQNGEDYEDKIRMHRSELHPALWFLYDKSCDQYRSYRSQMLDYKRQQIERQRERELVRQEEQQQNQKDPQQQQHQQHQQQQQEQHQHQQQQQQHHHHHHEDRNSNSAADKYDPESAISADIDSDDEYMRGMMDRNRDNIKRRIECRNELSDEERREREESEEAATAAGATDDHDDEEEDEEEEKEMQRQRRKRDRKSRWGEKELHLPSGSCTSSGIFANQNKPMLSTITRSDPALLQYARLNYGSTQLTEDQWKQCEEHYKVNLLYQDMMRKRQEIDRLARGGKFKYEYDSDEDIEGGTWEHKLRTAEMEATSLWANALTKQSEGKHHIGDFLPPEELKKFMEQYEAKKNNRQPDLSDYKEYKLKEDNIGFQMLQKLGWKAGQGLGQDGAGIVNPVNKAPQRDGNQGLGVSSAAAPEDCDNEYDAYRKRMMLAYRFRPNPLNNPRRAYY